MMHYYKPESQAGMVFDMFMQVNSMRACKTKWKYCSTKKHLIAECKHGKRGILDKGGV